MLTEEDAVEIKVLARQGKSIRQIARELRISRNTVRCYLREDSVPGYGPRAVRPIKLDPFKAYLEERIAARGTFDPAYLNYTLGKLMIRKLRNDWTGSRRGRNAWRAFHDKLLSYGGPSIPLMREAMLGPNAGPPF